jgi:hypothetical protein
MTKTPLLPKHVTPGMLDSITTAYKVNEYCIGCGEWVDSWNGHKEGNGDFWCEKCYKKEINKELDRIGLDKFVDFCISSDTMGIKFWEIDYDKAPIEAYKEYDLEVLDNIRVMDEHARLQEFWELINEFEMKE